MLLEELINTKVKNLKTKYNYFNKPTIDDRNVLGYGTVASVTQDKNDPHMVKRKTHNVVSNKKSNPSDFNQYRRDGYRDYAEFIIKNKIAERNPWFPRIYEMKDFEAKNQTHLQKYTLEKLEKMSTLSAEEVVGLIERLFPTIEHSQLDLDADYEDDDGNVHSPVWTLDELIRSYFNGNAWVDKHGEEHKFGQVDETMADAKNILDEFVKGYDGRVNDVGDSNSMVRRGRYGVQIVHTDPVY